MKKITINNLSFYYESKDTMVFDRLSLEFSSEKIYALVGSNGVGKTTLLNIGFESISWTHFRRDG